jgi:uncharacterized protein YqjF (DUF2071 family)
MTLPLTMNGRLEECLLMSYRTPARAVRDLVPRGLELLTRDGFAFWNVVACRVEAMRPTGVPRPLGAGYRHVAYRLHVRARTSAGETLDGLYFVRSDADSTRVSRFGNLLTDFRFHRSDVELSHAKDGANDVLTLAIQGRDDAAADALVRVATQPQGAPAEAPAPDSLFTSAAEADRFLRYRPLGLSVDIDGRYLHLARVLRDQSAWRERPVCVIEAHWKFFDALGQDDLRLERATRVDPIDYRWRLGRRVALASPVPPVPTAHRPATPARAAA